MLCAWPTIAEAVSADIILARRQWASAKGGAEPENHKVSSSLHSSWGCSEDE